jgi:cytochrome c oxidase assembly protein subunit 15
VWRRYLVLVAVVLAQGALGGVQYALGVPEVLVSLHVLGAGLATVAAAALWAGLTERPHLALPEPAPAPEPALAERA